MKVTSREMLLGWMTGLVVLAALSVWICSPKIKVWKELIEQSATVKKRIVMAEHLASQRGHWNKRLEGVAEKLSRYPADEDVTAAYLKIIENVVKDNNVTLSQRRPQKEKKQKDIYQMAVDCTWEAGLDALVNFLYALEQQKVTMDIDDLNISLVAGGSGRLKGSFAMICIYTRSETPPAAAKKETIPAQINK